MVTLSQLLASLQRLVAADPKTGTFPVLLVQDDWGDDVADLTEEPATIGFYRRNGDGPELVETGPGMNGATSCVVLWPKA